jgi:uncharacterized protein
MRTRFIGACAALALLAVSAVALAQSTDAAVARHEAAVSQHYDTLTRQAAIGSAKAQYELSLAYANGDGGNWPKDEYRAVGWLRRAAEQGLARAQFALGFRLEMGEGVQRDYAQAASWYRKSAEQGNAEAQYALGAMYEQGGGVSQSFTQAYFWLNLAASGKQSSEFMQDQCRKARDDAASHLTKETLLQTQERARKWSEDHTAKP